jgi:imidazolonepropionase-like amidohydrolase
MQSTGCPCCAYPQSMSAPALLGRGSAARQHRRRARLPEASAANTPGNLQIDWGTVVDPRDGSTSANVSIRIQAGRIVEIAAAEEALAYPAAERVDATGKFIVPGYNDMHSHALNLDDPSGSLALMLAEGVTGFRQMSGSPALLEKRRNDALPIGTAAPALLETPGAVLTPLNAPSRKDVVAEVRRQKAQGADFVKMVVANPDVFFAAIEAAVAAGIPILGHLQEGVDAVAAARAGFRSIEHLGPGSSIWLSCSTIGEKLLAEVSDHPVIKAPPFKIPFIERIAGRRMRNMVVNPAAFTDPGDVARIQRALDTYSPDRATAAAAQLAELGTWQVPTLVRLRSMQYAGAPEYERDESLKYLPADNLKRWRTVTKKFLTLPAETRATYRDLYPRQLDLAKMFADAGVRMMTGTDGGSLMAPGTTLRQEFAELTQAGFSPLKILQMTTIDPADYLGRRDTMGTVEPGRNADLVMLDANPLENVDNLHRINAVIRAGRHYSATRLTDLKARVATGHGYLAR